MNAQSSRLVLISQRILELVHQIKCFLWTQDFGKLKPKDCQCSGKTIGNEKWIITYSKILMWFHNWYLVILSARNRNPVCSYKKLHTEEDNCADMHFTHDGLSWLVWKDTDLSCNSLYFGNALEWNKQSSNGNKGQDMIWEKHIQSPWPKSVVTFKVEHILAISNVTGNVFNESIVMWNWTCNR